MKKVFASKLEYFSGALLITGFILFWLGMEILAYSVVFLGIISSAYTIFKNPFSGVYMTIFFLPLTKTPKLPYVSNKIALVDVLFVITFIVYLFKEDLFSNQNLRRFSKEYYLIPLGLFLFFSFLSVVNAISIVSWAVEVASYLFLAVFFLFLIHSLDNR